MEDGSMETGDFDEEGLHNGDTKMTWRNGSTREGRHLYAWAGYDYAWKRDLEIWEDGALLKAVKYYGEDLMVEDWGTWTNWWIMKRAASVP
ncbi:Uncharacterized protein FKW44_003988 [Caligus rogercresseyi]|uniref:Uncharacterized protein n=1 Tax=Caligus rogercresseyi TaxID=217165 RepID=A0A7T8K9M3_CALRO|nr:Uncharacterized protein FKW44_003988 [Caligus rogercresseyi]